jgi:hypothetical protein
MDSTSWIDTRTCRHLSSSSDEVGDWSSIKNTEIYCSWWFKPDNTLINEEFEKKVSGSGNKIIRAHGV